MCVNIPDTKSLFGGKGNMFTGLDLGDSEMFCCRSNAVNSLFSLSSHLFFQSGHPLLQMELQPLVGLRQQLVHCVGETLVVFIVHPLPLPRLRGRERDG